MDITSYSVKKTNFKSSSTESTNLKIKLKNKSNINKLSLISYIIKRNTFTNKRKNYFIKLKLTNKNWRTNHKHLMLLTMSPVKYTRRHTLSHLIWRLKSSMTAKIPRSVTRLSKSKVKIPKLLKENNTWKSVNRAKKQMIIKIIKLNLLDAKSLMKNIKD